MQKTEILLDRRIDKKIIQKIATRQILPVILLIAGAWMLHDRFLALDFSLIQTTLQQVSGQQWGLAIAATLVSFWAIGRYDEVVHGLLDTGIPAQTARISGASSIASAQFAGFGILTGALARWRLLPEFSLFQAARISLVVSGSFIFGWAIVTAISVLLHNPSLEHGEVLASGVLVLFFIIAGLSVWQPDGLPKIPSLRAIGSILVLVGIDLLFAGAAMYAVLPADITVPPTLFFSVFLLAFGVGLVGGTPGGLGSFELVMIALLPFAQVETLLASVLAYRLVYFALPAGIGTIILIAGKIPQADRDPLKVLLRPAPVISPDLERQLWLSGNAETNLLRQGIFRCYSINNRPVAMVASLGQSMVMLGNPLTNQSVDRTLQQIKMLASRKKLGAIVYKCPARLSVAARKRGWKIMPVVREAWIRPATFTTDGSSRRQLRRLMRKATAAGVEVSECGRHLPLDDLNSVSNSWASRHRGERGFSMGRYDDCYIKCQRVFIARVDDRIVAFLTIHENQNEWAVDLMRSQPNVPDGAMHMLIAKTIESAASCRIPRFSFASVPHVIQGENPLIAYLRKQVCNAGNADGLYRFKKSFDPNWVTLYAVAPGRLTLFLGLVDILRAIRARSTTGNAFNS